jgi:tetratricopeptide (TPR) repeat protein
MSEARPLFLQLAEINLKNNRQPEAVGLLKKLLLAEPDNIRIQIRLADLYQAMGQTKEAIEAYVSASQRALARGDQAESEKLAEKALKLDPNNLASVIVKARSYSTQGNFAQASELLERVPDLEKGGEQTELLLDLYLKNSKWDKAIALALRVFDADEKNFGPTQKVVEALLESGQGEKAMSILERTRLPMIDAGEHELVGRLLNDLAAHLPGRLEPLEWLVETYGRTSDSFRLPDALAHLGDALVAAKQYDRAKATFEQLVDREPESDSAKRKLHDCLRKMGLMAPEAAPPPVEDLDFQAEIPKAPPPKLRPAVEKAAPEVKAKPAAESASEPALDEDTQKFIAQSLTDVDLFASYGLTQKAIGLLEAILRRAPRHTPTLEKLLDFVLGAGDDRRTAELAAQLEQIHQQRGDQRSSERFGELRRRFQRAAGLTDEELLAMPTVSAPVIEASVPAAAEEFAVPEISAEPAQPEIEEIPVAPAAQAAPPPEPAAAEEVHEVDLSDEWASMLEEKPGAASAAKPAEFEISAESETVEEFAIGEEPAAAEPAHEEPAIVPPADVPAFAEFEVGEEPAPAVEEPPSYEEIAAAPPAPPAPKSPAPAPPAPKAAPPAAKTPPPPPAPVVEEISLDDFTLPEPEQVAPPPPPPAAKAQPEKPKSPAPVPVPEPEFELDQDYELVLDQEPLVPAYDQKPPEKPVVPVAPTPEPVAQNATPAPPSGSNFASDQFLADLADEIDQLGIGELSPGFSGNTPQPEVQAAAKTPTAPPKPSVEPGPLKEVFDEFRAELGEMGAEEEDLETHYNLGIAFREMGLLEEAISEFQKVAKATENGRAFRYTMQCCTLLGLAFMEKGQPNIAAIWYERALKTPGNEPESILALRYDLGVAQESAGEPEAALKSFSQVYAMNIDYRDVAERIAALQKPTR